MKVYISGKISGLEESEYLPMFAEAAEFLKKCGHEPVNPLEVDPGCNEACKSGLSFEDGRYMHTWQCYMKADIKALLECDAIMALDNAGDSRGAQLELELASHLDIVEIVRVGNELEMA